MVSEMKSENLVGGRKYCGGKMIDMREAWGSKKERAGLDYCLRELEMHETMYESVLTVTCLHEADYEEEQL